MTFGWDDDRDRVSRMLSGDEQAFEEFFALACPALFRFALGRVPDAAAAEEVVQAALGTAVGKLHTWRGEASLLTWLHVFCRHEIAAWYEQRARHAPEVDLVEELPGVRAALESLSAAEAGARERQDEVRRLVQATLDALPARYGDVLEWKYIEGLSVAEIAARLAMGTKAAESLLGRARKAFREGFLAVGGATGLTVAEAE